MSFKNKVNISVLISLLSVILLLFVLGVYAQDNDTVITNGTDINTTSVNNTNNSIREVDVHNYVELKTAVDNLTSHPCGKLVINLEDGDYKINTDPIQVKKNQNIEINGNRQTIDCNQKHFMDITRGGSVTINNLEVQNADDHHLGGAINNQGTLTVHDSTFKNNKAGYGGAIFNDVGTLTVTGSTFINNHATHEGGAIFNEIGKVTVTSSSLNNNKADTDGGAIGNYAGTLTVISSSLNNNKADTDGGAIHTEKGTLTVKDSTFNNNKANYGGAIKNTGTLTVTGSTFTDNDVSINGGAIHNGGGKYNIGTLTVTESTFDNNKADKDGGAIYNENELNPIQNCTFENNIANSGASGRCEGGAIKCTGNNNPLIVTGCQFTGNRAEDGGAIDCRVLQIRNCAFTQNTASNAVLVCYGGAINCNDLNECHDCNFTSNTANDGGAIAIMEKAGINNIKDCIFKDNKATGQGTGKGGVIFVNRMAAHISLVHNQFINNDGTDGDNVYNWGHYDKIEHNYFQNKDQNKFIEYKFMKVDKIHKDTNPFYNLEDYYKWKG